jgi:hypothetical protein
MDRLPNFSRSVLVSAYRKEQSMASSLRPMPVSVTPNTVIVRYQQPMLRPSGLATVLAASKYVSPEITCIRYSQRTRTRTTGRLQPRITKAHASSRPPPPPPPPPPLLLPANEEAEDEEEDRDVRTSRPSGDDVCCRTNGPNTTSGARLCCPKYLKVARSTPSATPPSMASGRRSHDEPQSLPAFISEALNPVVHLSDMLARSVMDRSAALKAMLDHSVVRPFVDT